MSDILNRLARLPRERRAEFLALLRDELEAPVRSGPKPRGDAGPAPLSFAQETLWFLDRLAPGRPTYNVPFCFRMLGDLDAEALQKGLADVVARHEALRTCLVEQSEGPVQVVVPEIPVSLPVTEVGDGGPQEPMVLARRLGVAEARRPFDLSQPPLWRARLLRLAPDDHVLVFIVHHVVFDGWSLGVFASELAETYRAARMGEESSLPPPSVQYADYACWQRDHFLQGKTLQDLVDFWRDRLAKVPVLEFPTDRPRPAQATFNGTFLRRVLPLEVPERIRALAHQEGVTPYTVFVAAFFVLLHRYSGQSDLVIGSPTANRSQSEVEHIIGFFVNMLVLRADLSGDPTFRETVHRVWTVIQDAFAHGDLPFEKLVEGVRPLREPSRSPVFQIAYSFQNAGAPLELAGLSVEQEFLDQGTSRFDMSWNVFERPDGLELNVEFNIDLFDRETIEQLVAHYERIMRAAATGPDMPISRLPMLGDAERHALVHNWIGSRRPVPRTVVAELFQQQVRRNPKAVALVVGDEVLTYEGLNWRANQLAHLLREMGAGTRERVALCLRRSADLVVAVLAVLKAGAAYVPLDPTHPSNRLAAILDDATPRAVVTDSSFADRLPAGGPAVLRLDMLGEALERQPGSDPPVTVRSDDLAYLLYTSGSTGRPKGVLIEQHSVVNFVISVQELFRLTPDDRVLGFASITFDVSVFEMLSALLTGARLHLLRDEERMSVERLQEIIERSPITVIDLPPSVMALLEPECFDDLRIAFVGGEAFPGELVNRWNRKRRFFNGYGPTECTVTMIVHECAGHWDSAPPIGLPMPNHVAHVVDQHLEPVPFGVAGELVIGGDGLARGYLNCPQLTDEKFVADPFGTAPGGRLYHTGDLAKRRRDGTIVFLGRIDQQVKIRGLRIELGEIEAVLSSHAMVSQVAVEPWSDGHGETHLVAYMTRGAQRLPHQSELRDHLAEHLPSYMIPSYFVELESLPLTPSGKVDRRALPTPDISPPPGGVASRNETERVLAEEILTPILGLDRVGIHDNFFELGGNSLQAAQLISRIRHHFAAEVSLAEFFRSPTVANLASILDRQKASRMSDEELLDMLQSMSDEDVARLMRPEPTERRA